MITPINGKNDKKQKKKYYKEAFSTEFLYMTISLVLVCYVKFRSSFHINRYIVINIFFISIMQRITCFDAYVSDQGNIVINYG